MIDGALKVLLLIVVKICVCLQRGIDMRMKGKAVGTCLSAAEASSVFPEKAGQVSLFFYPGDMPAGLNT